MSAQAFTGLIQRVDVTLATGHTEFCLVDVDVIDGYACNHASGLNFDHSLGFGIPNHFI